MPDQENGGGIPPYNLNHIPIEGFRETVEYGRPQRDMSGRSSGRNRAAHGQKLRAELAAALAAARQELTLRDPDVQRGRAGLYLEVESAADGKLPDLTWKQKHIRLTAARLTEEGAEKGAVFVPLDASDFLENTVREYIDEDTPGGTAKHKDRIEPLETIRVGTIESLWTDQRPLPGAQEAIWWECWCWRDVVSNLTAAAERMGLRVSEARLKFPEFDVVPVYGTRVHITRLLQNTDAIAELRRASDSPVFFTVQQRREQNLWVDDLVRRITPPAAGDPAVCILDNGVARAHPLLEGAIPAEDCLTVNEDWGADDHDDGGHGTNMAGTALYGDLTYPLADGRAVELTYGLESVKFLPPPGVQPTDPRNYGVITQTAVAVPEIEKPDRPRVFCMAVTNDDVSGERPTSWSAAIDQLCAGTMPGDETDGNGDPPRRLFVVSAGNIPDAANPDDISDPDEFPIEDPAQAWNALTVGGFTDKTDITDAGYASWTPVAEVGDRSPYSRISTDWEHSRTPIKPEVVFEAGNRALSPAQTEVIAGLDSLSLLTTNKDFLAQPLTTFWATSPATAQAAGMAAAIMASNPGLWPETVRALMVHSAEWTPKMLEQLNAQTRKRDRIKLARSFGYGVPKLERAIASARNDVALVAQSTIKPFKRVRKFNADGSAYWAEPTFDEAHYYELPWPRAALEALGAEDVRLKVTLSYFIEPSPGDIAPVTPARYQSFGLRFEMKRPSDTPEHFRQRINRLERDGDLPDAEADHRWMFGPQSISAGSLHCDMWAGPGAELAARDMIAVYPVSGWWRYRVPLRRYDSVARYSLVVSISTAETDVNLYAEIAAEAGITIATEIEA